MLLPWFKMIKLPIVKSCCCGCSLATGSLIIAWLELAFGIFGVFSGILTLLSAGPMDAVVFSIIFGGIGIIISTLLVQGIRQMDMKKIDVWIMSSFVSTAIYFCLFVIQMILLTINFHVIPMALQLIVGLIILLFKVHNIIIVYSYKFEILLEREPPV